MAWERYMCARLSLHPIELYNLNDFNMHHLNPLFPFHSNFIFNVSYSNFFSLILLFFLDMQAYLKRESYYRAGR